MLDQLAAIVTDGVLLGLIYAIAGLGLSLVLGIMGIVNVAHSAFIMLGSFFAFELFRRFGVDPIVSFFLAMPVFFLLGTIVYRVLLTRVERVSQSQGLVAMFGLMVLIENLSTIAWTTNTRVITAAYTQHLAGTRLALCRASETDRRRAGARPHLHILGVPALHADRPRHPRHGAESRCRR